MRAAENDRNELVTIRWYTDILIANVDRSKLESEGITCFLHDENIGGLNFMYAYAVNGIKLKVRACDASHAIRILQTDEDDTLRESPEVCPHCGSTGSDYSNRRHGLVNALSLFLFGFPLLFPGRGYRCNACGKTSNRDYRFIITIVFLLFLTAIIVDHIYREGVVR